MLAWVRGQGWVRDDAVRIPGETAVSEDFRLDALRVTAPEGAAVSGAGRADPPAPGPRAGTTTHVFRADAVRDVSVAVGAYRVLERDIAGTRLHLFTPVSGTRTDPERWAAELDGAVRRLQDLFGPFPYPDLWVAIAPSQTSGLEYPGALQFGDTPPQELGELAAHELAHQWFYALVGNDQGRDPWIDEAFATYAQAVVTGTADDYALDDVPARLRGRLGDPMAVWADRGFGPYNVGVYTQGAAALVAAREQAGEERFDEAVRAYVAANAHRVVTPGDVARGFADAARRDRPADPRRRAAPARLSTPPPSSPPRSPPEKSRGATAMSPTETPVRDPAPPRRAAPGTRHPSSRAAAGASSGSTPPGAWRCSG